MANGIGSRIAEVRDKTARRFFADHIGIAENTLRNYEKGLSLPNSDVIAAICAKYGICSDWLIDGILPMRREGAGKTEQSGKIQPDAESGRDEFAHIPVIGLATCGFEGWYNQDRVALNASVPSEWAKKGMFAVIAVGESMEPEGIRQGFVAICDPEAVPKRDDVIYLERKDLEAGTSHASIKKYIGQDEEWLYLDSWARDEKGVFHKEHAQLAREFVTRLAVVVMVKRKA